MSKKKLLWPLNIYKILRKAPKWLQHQRIQGSTEKEKIRQREKKKKRTKKQTNWQSLKRIKKKLQKSGKSYKASKMNAVKMKGEKII